MNHPQLTPAFCAANGIIITRFEGKSLYFGLVNYDDAILKTRILKAFPGWQCVFQEMEGEDFNLKLSQLFSEEEAGEGSGADERGSRESIIDRVADDAPIVNLLNSIFLEALSKHASDIHVESGCDETVIRYRTDGILVPFKRITNERAIAVSARLKILANLNVLENRRPQDGHLDVKTDSYSLDVRISIVPTIWGESIVLRLLNRSDSPLSLDSLGFSEKNSLCLKSILAITSGLVLVTGPTGSGKTTTLAALLKELDVKSAKIISIEDPVEYRVSGITQIQVREELGLTFDALLRRIFRQDPDVIMIGEIRDIETAELAIRAALTGHLVFATLHTNNAVEAVYRLQNMGIPEYMAAAVLKMVIAQRLVRKVCPECGASGCDSCSRTGFRGRTVVAEFIPVDTAMADMISSGVAIQQLRRYLQNRKFRSIFDDAEEKAASGITTEAEIRRELGAQGVQGVRQ
ncbi:MAG: GspE/PulE family protein [Treponema sp.]|jgi:general secretion pathway protein E/type IV pilus assembly protein PilB|nr:GspE/PulE family protein [Treponema sp.]